MEAILIKRINKFEGVHYILKDEKGWIKASTLSKEKGLSLSLKNCQVVEHGYDLDELARESSKEYFIKPIESPIFTFGYEEGFQKALELMGDKKFSEEDIHQALHLMNNRARIPIEGEALDIISKIEKQRDEIIQPLQQMEWDVEIKMEEYEPLYGEGSTLRPKLDQDGCLILKRI